jgi:hypothetical protein
LDPATGEMRPLRQARILGGVPYHRSSHLDLYAYTGDEYTGRYAFVAPDGTAGGYGSRLVNYATCANDVALDSCKGDNRNISDATVGYCYRLYGSEYGRIEQGNQVGYMRRNLWSGIGKTPQGGDLVVFSTLPFYLP